MLFDSSNLPYWIFLGIGVFLFLFTIVSGGGDDDLDVDADADVDADVDADGGEFHFGTALGWLGIGKAPLVLLLATDLSVWGVVGWLLNVVIGGWLGGVVSGIVGGAVMLGSLILAAVAGSAIAHPVGQIFASFGEDASGDRLIGCVGTVSTAMIPALRDGRIGQVDVLDPAHNLVTVNAVVPDWATFVPKRGDKVLVIEHPSSTYFVIVKDSPDQERWLSNSSQPKPIH